MPEDLDIDNQQLETTIKKLKHKNTLEDVVVNTLINGYVTDITGKSLLYAGTLLDIDLTKPHVVVAAEINPDRAATFFKNSPTANGKPTLSTPHVRNIAAMIMPAGHQDHEDTTQTIAKYFSSLTQLNPAEANVGISRPAATLTDYQNRWYQAIAALELGKMEKGLGQVVTLDQLGIYSLLFDTRRHNALMQYLEAQLGPLLRYDHAKGSNLTSTLSIFYRSEFSTEITKKRVMVSHTNTVKYRLKRAVEILGLEYVSDLKTECPRFLPALKIYDAVPVIKTLDELCPN